MSVVVYGLLYFFFRARIIIGKIAKRAQNICMSCKKGAIAKTVTNCKKGAMCKLQKGRNSGKCHKLQKGRNVLIAKRGAILKNVTNCKKGARS